MKVLSEEAEEGKEEQWSGSCYQWGKLHFSFKSHLYFYATLIECSCPSIWFYECILNVVIWFVCSFCSLRKYCFWVLCMYLELYNVFLIIKLVYVMSLNYRTLRIMLVYASSKHISLGVRYSLCFMHLGTHDAASDCRIWTYLHLMAFGSFVCFWILFETVAIGIYVMIFKCFNFFISKYLEEPSFVPLLLAEMIAFILDNSS